MLSKRFVFTYTVIMGFYPSGSRVAGYLNL
uniref:Uncharacterized protein n=2 Tax=Anguilla anguilla TaxID=7936 RepID=A0A0E9PU16_ANGAN